MPDFGYYQTYLQAGLEEIERYLLSDDLFWSVSVVPSADVSYPNLTLGGLLLYQVYARVLAETSSQQVSYQKLENQLNSLRSHWRVAWERKATWEFEARLRQWGNVLKEIRSDPTENVAYYRYEVRIRVLLALLRHEIPEVDTAYLEHLDNLDTILQALFEPGDFIWEQGFTSAFPKDVYWYLWGEPREPKF